MEPTTLRCRRTAVRIVAVLAWLPLSVGCAAGASSGASQEPSPGPPSSAPHESTSPAAPSTPTSAVTTTATTTTTTPATSTSTTTTTATTTTTTTVPDEPVTFEATTAAFASLASGNAATSLSVWRDGMPVVQLATGVDRSGAPVTGTTPMVVASVSKLVTALTVARLHAADVLDVMAPVPWAAMGFEPHPAWLDVTPRQLLDHTSGMPVAQQSWLDDPGSCAAPLGMILGAPPTDQRGRWRYSNGNYCALGLLIEAVTGERYDVPGRWLVFAPAGVDGPRLTVDGSAPGDGPHRADIARFDRLGAAGSWLAGTDHVAAVLAAATLDDRRILRWPGIFLDQYGWGHTGTLRGAKACAWVIEDGRTVVAATVAGERPSSGGGVCDVLLPALGADLRLTGVDGRALGTPDRSPP